MRALPIPGWDVAEVFEQCVSNLIPISRRQRFLGIVTRVGELEQNYSLLAQEGRAHRLPMLMTLAGDEGEVSGDEVYQLYDSKLVSKTAPSRKVYDKLRLSSPGNICPYCGQSPVRTLDHYLPRSHAKFLAISPLNLVPCCRDCNHEKDEFLADSDQESLIHPYFDRGFEAVEWLKAEIVEVDPVALKFFVVDSDDPLVRRAASHFRVFNLGFYYATHSAVELINSRTLLKRLHEAGGSAAVKEELEGRLMSAVDMSRNAWQAAFYRALLKSDQFCDGGFIAIPTSARVSDPLVA